MSWYATIACVLFPAYFLLDVNYFIRSAITIIMAKSRKKIRFLEPSTIYGFVITNDIDFLLTHMNNARFLREMDFARIDHGTRSGFMEETVRRGGMILLSSSFIRYRLPLPVFSRYKVETNVVYWDEKNVYLVHKVITLQDGIIRAVVYAKATCLKVNVHEIAEYVSPSIEQPDIDSIPPDYKKWMETLELSSKLMKANMAGGGDGKGVKPKPLEKTKDIITSSEKLCPLTLLQTNKENGSSNIIPTGCKDSSDKQYSFENLMHQD